MGEPEAAKGQAAEGGTETLDAGGRLLSTARGMLVGLTVFFLLASLGQLFYLQRQVAQVPALDLEALIDKRMGRVAPEDLRSLMELESRAALEEHALKRRYHQANVLLMSRLWISYLSFVTGMILSMVGASFVLGRIREPVTKLDAGSDVARFSIASSSPGIILAALGTLLIACSILTNHQIVVEDRPVYFATYQYDSTTVPPAIPSDREDHVDPAETSSDELDRLDQILDSP